MSTNTAKSLVVIWSVTKCDIHPALAGTIFQQADCIFQIFGPGDQNFNNQIWWQSLSEQWHLYKSLHTRKKWHLKTSILNLKNGTKKQYFFK